MNIMLIDVCSYFERNGQDFWYDGNEVEREFDKYEAKDSLNCNTNGFRFFVIPARIKSTRTKRIKKIVKKVERLDRTKPRMPPWSQFKCNEDLFILCPKCNQPKVMLSGLAEQGFIRIWCSFCNHILEEKMNYEKYLSHVKMLVY